MNANMINASPLPTLQPRESVGAAQTRMRAVIATGYGSVDVLKLTEQPTPTPKPNEVLIRVRATNVTAADSMMRRGDPAYARLFLGLRKPKAAIPGTGMAGIVQAVGDKVTRFRAGDEVFGESGLSFGAHAEYVCTPEDGVLLSKPKELSFVDAATLCDGPMTSYNFLRRIGCVEPGQRVLVNGASGALGTAAVQLAKHFGADVTAVCSGKNAELVTSLGADHVIDYTKEDFTSRNGHFDLIYDAVGKSSYRRCKKALSENGMYLSPVLRLPLLLQMLWTRFAGSKKAKFDATGLRPAAELRQFLSKLRDMATAGTLRSVVERTYRFDQILEAHAHVDSGRKKGSVVVSMEPA